jgi:hypothetical protein
MTDIILISKIDIVSPLEEEPDLIEIPVLGGLEKLHFEISHPTKNKSDTTTTVVSESWKYFETYEKTLGLFPMNQLISPHTAINKIHS